MYLLTIITLQKLGKNGGETFDKLCSSKHEKYFASGTPVKIPKDYYPDFIERADSKINGLKQEIKTLNSQNANPSLIAAKKAQLKKYETIRKNTYSSETTSKEALLARTNPKLYTAQSMLGTAHEAGLEGAKSGAVIGGGMAIVCNLGEVLKGKPIEDAVKDVAVKSAKSAVRSYAVSSGATLVDGGIQHYRSELPKLLKNAKAPTEIAGFVVDAASAFYNYYNGSISGVDCMKQLAVSASLALANLTPIGQAVFIARTVYTLASVSVSVIRDALKAPEIARERRIQIEKECEEQIKVLYPYVQATALVNELVNLEYTVRTGYIKIYEVGTTTKDRYSSIAYCNYYANELEKELKEEASNNYAYFML